MAKHPFGEFINREEYQQRASDQAAVSFEERKVTCLLRGLKLNISAVSRELRSVEAAQSGNQHLTFRAFGELYPTFPLFLGTSNLAGKALHLDGRSTLPALFKAFKKAPFYAAFEKFVEANPRKASWKVPALVFPRKGFRDGVVVYLSETVNTIPTLSDETFIVHRDHDSNRVLMVRAFASTVKAIYSNGQGWTPSDG